MFDLSLHFSFDDDSDLVLDDDSLSSDDSSLNSDLSSNLSSLVGESFHVFLHSQFELFRTSNTDLEFNDSNSWSDY